MGSHIPPPPTYDQEIHTITISNPVRQSGKPNLELIAEGVSFLHKDGIIILENAIDSFHLDTINSILGSEALEISQNPSHHFNFGKHTRNMDQAPPPTKSLMFRDVWNNAFAAAIISNIMGPRPVIHYANGNTALKAAPGGRQPVHSDCEFTHPVYFPFAYAINIPLVDVTAENGATEVWPGSHHVSTIEVHGSISETGYKAADECEDVLTIKQEYLEARRQHSPPVRACSQKGSIIIRDLRLWHAGMPNLTDDPRVMLAFVAQPAWFQAKSKILLPLSVRGLVEEWSKEEYSFTFAAEWVDGEVDHKKISSEGVDFNTGSKVLRKHTDVLSRWEDYVPRWH